MQAGRWGDDGHKKTKGQRMRCKKTRTRVCLCTCNLVQQCIPTLSPDMPVICLLSRLLWDFHFSPRGLPFPSLSLSSPLAPCPGRDCFPFPALLLPFSPPPSPDQMLPCPPFPSCITQPQPTRPITRFAITKHAINKHSLTSACFLTHPAYGNRILLLLRTYPNKATCRPATTRKAMK